MRALYHAVKNEVNRAVKTLFHDLVDEVSRDIYQSKAKIGTTSIILIFFNFSSPLTYEGHFEPSALILTI